MQHDEYQEFKDVAFVVTQLLTLSPALELIKRALLNWTT